MTSRSVTGVQRRSIDIDDEHLTVEVVVRGVVSLIDAQRTLDGARETLADPKLRGVVWNTLEHEGHDPGAVAMGLRWANEHRAILQGRRSALLTRSPTLAALVNVARVMLPWIDVAVFSSRNDAVAWVAAVPPRRINTPTGLARTRKTG